MKLRGEVELRTKERSRTGTEFHGRGIIFPHGRGGAANELNISPTECGRAIERTNMSVLCPTLSSRVRQIIRACERRSKTAAAAVECPFRGVDKEKGRHESQFVGLLSKGCQFMEKGCRFLMHADNRIPACRFQRNHEPCRFCILWLWST